MYAEIAQSGATLVVLLMTVLGYSPSFQKFNPLWRRSRKALNSFYTESDSVSVDQESETVQTVAGGEIDRGDDGFRLVKKAILQHRQEFKSYREEHGNFLKIGVTKTEEGNNYNGVFGAVIPGNFAYVVFEDGTTYPFLTNELEQRTLSTWTSRVIERYMAIVVIGLILIWTCISLWTIWGI